MNICGIELTGTQWAAIGSFAFAIASEVIGRSKLKQNSVVDVAMTLLSQRIGGAHTPRASDRKAPDAESPAPRPRGRPAKKAPSSRSGPK
jgi:hypothetical protein